jgi:hypothetical protein
VALYRSYTWTYQTQVPPYERLLDLLDAFYSANPLGDYTREEREAYKVRFRRGSWKRLAAIGPLVPARLVPGDFTQWPVMVSVLARPSPEAFHIAIRYDVHLPRGIKELDPKVQSSVDQHIRLELRELAAYLAECMGLSDPPLFELRA